VHGDGPIALKSYTKQSLLTLWRVVSYPSSACLLEILHGVVTGYRKIQAFGRQATLDGQKLQMRYGRTGARFNEENHGRKQLLPCVQHLQQCQFAQNGILFSDTFLDL